MLRNELVKQSNKILRLQEVTRTGVERFIHLEAAGSIVLLFVTVFALVLANSGLADQYFGLWKMKAGIVAGDFAFKASLHHWINDGLMALFFFLVGLEIKREIMVGELSSMRKAILPIFAALGGMAVPALLFLAFNAGKEGAGGWGIPMATDIAFALGILALLGKRIPGTLKVFMTALAIGDDIGAVIVIAIFYTAQINWVLLGIGLVCLGGLLFLNLIRTRSPLPYIILATAVWFSFFESGVHATIAGVLVALTIPTRTRRDPIEFVAWGKEKLDEIERLEDPSMHPLSKKYQQRVAAALQIAARSIQSPLRRIEHGLHPWTTFVILPLFALANAGVAMDGAALGDALLNPISLGVIFGLVIGKQLGITLFTYLAVKLRIADLPDGVTWKQIYAVSWLGGIGFTMSIFVSGLAFGEGPMLDDAKIGILAASLAAGVIGYVLLRLTANKEAVARAA